MRGEHTLEEMRTQPEAWEEVLSKDYTFPKTEGLIVFFGAGAAFAAAKTLAWSARKYMNKPAFAMSAQDIVTYPEYVRALDIDLFVALSRTGDVTDNILAVKTIREKLPYSRVLGIIGENELELGNICHEAYPMNIMERSVATTKTLSSIILSVQAMMARNQNISAYKDLLRLPELLRKETSTYDSLIQKIAHEKFDQIIFLGSGANYGIAEAGALAVLEMSVEISVAYETLVYLHGPCTTTNRLKTLIVVLLSRNLMKMELESMKKVNAENTTIVGLGGSSPFFDGNELDHNIVFTLGLNDEERSVLHLPFAQQLGVERSLNRGFNPDAPPSLEKVF